MKTRGVPSGYVEDLNDARTPLADFFSILLRNHNERSLACQGRQGYSWLHLATLFMSASAAIVDPLLRRAYGQRPAPRTLNVLHEYASGSHGSAISRRTVTNNVG